MFTNDHGVKTRKYSLLGRPIYRTLSMPKNMEQMVLTTILTKTKWHLEDNVVNIIMLYFSMTILLISM